MDDDSGGCGVDVGLMGSYQTAAAAVAGKGGSAVTVATEAWVRTEKRIDDCRSKQQ